MPGGYDVIYDGKLWNNQVHGIQPVWGVKESPHEDELPQQSEHRKSKTFAEILKEELEKQQSPKI